MCVFVLLLLVFWMRAINTKRTKSVDSMNINPIKYVYEPNNNNNHNNAQ